MARSQVLIISSAQATFGIGVGSAEHLVVVIEETE
jgi:hypothetical protein